MKGLYVRAKILYDTREKAEMTCPYAVYGVGVFKTCVMDRCAHYNSDTDECVHVEAAQAQVKMARLLEQRMGEQVESARPEPAPEANDIIQAARWLKQGQTVRRAIWTDGIAMVANRGHIQIVPVGKTQKQWGDPFDPTTDELLATDWEVYEE